MPQSTPAPLAHITPLQQLKAGKLAIRLPQLFIGLIGFGFSCALIIESGLGTIANAVLVGISADIALRFIPAPSNLPMQWAYVILAILAFSFFDALYIGSVWIRTKRRSDDGAHAHHRETCRNHPHSP